MRPEVNWNHPENYKIKKFLWRSEDGCVAGSICHNCKRRESCRDRNFCNHQRIKNNYILYLFWVTVYGDMHDTLLTDKDLFTLRFEYPYTYEQYRKKFPIGGDRC